MDFDLASIDCAQYVDFRTLSLNDCDDGADDWFDINRESDEPVAPTKPPKNNDFKENVMEKAKSKIAVMSSNLTTKGKKLSMDNRLPLSHKIKRHSLSKNLRRSPRLMNLKSINVNSTENSKGNVLKEVIQNSNFSKPAMLPMGNLKKEKQKPIRVPVKATDSPAGKQVEQKDFIASLRQFDKSNAKDENPRHTITKPKPFKLTESKRRTMPSVKEFRSIAQQVIAFQKQTPKRFHTKRKSSGSFKATTVKSKGVTVPKTPNLQTKHRSRPTTAISTEEKDLLEFEEIKKQQFKANPVDKRVLEHKMELKKVETKEGTVPVPFHLSQTNRNVRRRSTSLDARKVEFHARPIPPGILAGPKGLAPFKSIPLTDPHSPAFIWKNRLRRRSLSEEQKKTPHVKFVTPPVIRKHNHSTVPAATHGIRNHLKCDKKITVSEPFSFYDKDCERMMKKEEKIKEFVEQEKKLREFRAQPMPDLSVVKIPEKLARPPTEPQPFSFLKEGDLSGLRRAEKCKREMEEECQKQRELTEFKAKPAKVTREPPFIPTKSNKALTCIQNFELKTEIRAGERSDYDDWLKDKEAQKEQICRERAVEEEERQRAELEQLRKDAVHRANPVRQYKPVVIKKSELPLTTPLSPFVSRKVMENRDLNDSE